jgi:hypothetical protein
MFTLAFAWRKSISGKGIVSLSCPIVRVEATIQGGRSYLSIVSGANGWEGYGFYSPEDGTVFRGTIDDILKGRHRTVVSIPFWFLAMVVSLVFVALFLIQRRRMRIWEKWVPADLTKSEIE